MIEPPAVAVIFRSTRRADDGVAYASMADRLAKILVAQEGFLGMESVRDSESGQGITVCFWRDHDCVRAWHDVAEHRRAQRLGIAEWYDSYEVVVADVTRAYGSSLRGTAENSFSPRG